MHKRALIFFTAIFILGAFFVGNGLTGLYILEFKQPPCDEDIDCQNTEVCCKFYNEEFGVCDEVDECDAIEKVTFDARRKISTYDSLEKKSFFPLSLVSKHAESPSRPSMLYSTIVGLVLVLFAIAGFFIGKVRDIHSGRSKPFYRHS